ncbi:MBL fold metallo-hydrolase [Aneurinibacillus danicus]|jgi:glyoxylase-like metal-dependent hydrolase (beta-lactamase superfamily II)|uniref:Putative metallo-hydrolase YqjP n=1 Tax=Aneurinibacillus danicus TaxID=267746 RepID=A0A511V619_9BACL|nr:MBL fold metallo-hydrolase [Aneurinibacillus danicus]GEN33173.1 putative metallo-hydrolase YqjP [Aneurinibacillus danicus]
MERTNQSIEVLPLKIPTPFSVGPINVFLLKGESCTLVDVGPKTKEAFELLDRFLKENGLAWHNIDQVFLTHQHVDHSGLTAEVVTRSDAKVIAHPDAVPYVTMDEAFMQHHDDFFRTLYEENGVPRTLLGYVERFKEMMAIYSEPAPVHQTMTGGEKLEGCEEWRTVFTPGHTQNHLALYREQDGLMLSGDFLIKEISSNAFVEPPMRSGQKRPRPLLVYRDAMQRIAEIPVRRMLSAHGEEIENPAELIAYRLRRNDDRAEKIRELLTDGDKTVFELTQLLFPAIYLKELPLTFSEILGHLDLLEERKQVEAVWIEKEHIYRYKQVK